MKICVLGLGYIGLPTSLLFADAGNYVIGVDINSDIIDKLKTGKLPFEEPGLEDLYSRAKSNFEVSNKVKKSDVYIIAVPTPLDKDMKIADLSAVRAASIAISKVINQKEMVILESTVPPGTSENIVLPILRKNGINTMNYAYCPERAFPGKTLNEMIYNDRVIGGINNKSIKIAKNLYTCFVKGNIYTTDDKTAEFIKLMENAFRDINIALANEFSLIAEEAKINIWEAIELANKHPRVKILKPGPGVGGHCIAIDPLFLAEKTSKSKIVTVAREINNYMSFHVLKLAKEMIKDIKNPTITLLGLAYKANIDDIRESPALKIKKYAENEGISVKIFDPLVKTYPQNCKSLDISLKNSDCLVLVTDHEVFKEINPKNIKMKHKNLLDTRNMLDHEKWLKSGFNVKIIGNGVERNKLKV